MRKIIWNFLHNRYVFYRDRPGFEPELEIILRMFDTYNFFYLGIDR